LGDAPRKNLGREWGERTKLSGNPDWGKIGWLKNGRKKYSGGLQGKNYGGQKFKGRKKKGKAQTRDSRHLRHH